MIHSKGGEQRVYDPIAERNVPIQDYVESMEGRMRKERGWGRASLAESYLKFALNDGSCSYTMLPEAIDALMHPDYEGPRGKEELKMIAAEVKEKFGIE